MAFLKYFFGLFRGRGQPDNSSFEPPCTAEYIVFGIGNEGREYENTRHNAGFAVVDKCLGKSTAVSRIERSYGGVATGVLAEKKIAFVKPNTFVNRCGKALKSGIEEFGVPLGSCLVIVDDYNLPLGTMRFRREGSDGGHNGLKSIIDAVGPEFPRLRIGVGPLPQGANAVDFVLGAFSREEEKILSAVIGKAVDGIEVFLNQGIEKAMSLFNGQHDKTQVNNSTM